MRKRSLFILVSVLGLLLLLGGTGLSAPPEPSAFQQLEHDAVNGLEIVQSDLAAYPSFVSGEVRIPLAVQKEGGDAAAQSMGFMERHADAFGVRDPQEELVVTDAEADTLGMTHVTMQQVYEGVEVYNAQMKVHLSADGRSVLAVSNGFVTGIDLSSTRPQVSADEALVIARKSLPNGALIAPPELVVFPGVGSQRSGYSARLAWLVELADDSVPARNVYVVDAHHGILVDVLEKLYTQDAGQSQRAMDNALESTTDERVIDKQVSDKVDFGVMQGTENGAEINFFIVLTEQADLSEAEKFIAKKEKGRYVYQTLLDNAQRSQRPLLSWLDSQGIDYQSFYIVNAVLVTGNRSLVRLIAQRADVALIEANPEIAVLPNDPSLMTQTADIDELGDANSIEPNIQEVYAPSLWRRGTTGQGIVIGGQDTGYDWDHPALKNQYRGWNGNIVDHNYNWHDSVHHDGGTCGHDSPEPCDDGDHGTHTMGTVIGSDGGVNRIGMAPGAKWIGCRNMNNGVGTPASYLECFEFFMAPYPVNSSPAQGNPDMAPDVTVNSWSCPPEEGCSWQVLQFAVESQRAAGIMTVVSAGNEGRNGCGSISSPPAIYDDAYTVGALKTGSNELASFSSRGTVSVDGSNRRKPDIVAPGTDIRSSVPGGGYVGDKSGTSMAGPHIAGAVALLWSVRPDLIGQIDTTENYINDNAFHIESTECSSSGWPNNLFGYGKLDVLATYRDALSLAGRFREIYDAEHSTDLPGKLLRSEGDSPTGDQDVDQCYDYSGNTYDYYANTHGRDSYDDQGVTMVCTANYGNNYQNAFWNGYQIVFGDDMVVEDVTAHEWTHAVTQHTANLEYYWQSGALNESVSDIFGAMVDRDDWLMGEDLPEDVLGGRDAIRDLSDPARLGQPGHTDDWLETCSDHEGVHTNSGITNKAYFNIATAIGKDKAERIFYRTLITYLQITSSLEDARAGALQSAEDLFGAGSTEYNAVQDGFNAVGLDGNWNPPANDCGPCSAAVALKYNSSDQSTANSLSSLYQLRDSVMSTTSAGKHYQKLYYQHTGRIKELMWRNPQLLVQGSMILEEVMPSLADLAEGRGSQALLTEKMTGDLTSFLKNLANEDRKQGGGELAKVIERELKLLRLDHLAGMDFEQAWGNLNKPALQLDSDSLQ